MPASRIHVYLSHPRYLHAIRDRLSVYHHLGHIDDRYARLHRIPHITLDGQIRFWQFTCTISVASTRFHRGSACVNPAALERLGNCSRVSAISAVWHLLGTCIWSCTGRFKAASSTEATPLGCYAPSLVSPVGSQGCVHAPMPPPAIHPRTKVCPMSNDNAPDNKRSRLKTGSIAIFTTLVYLWLAVLGCGGFAAFFDHPARTILAVASIVMASAAFLSDANLSSGEREDRSNRWILPAPVGGWSPEQSSCQPTLSERSYGFSMEISFAGLASFSMWQVARCGSGPSLSSAAASAVWWPFSPGTSWLPTVFTASSVTRAIWD